jgi:RimJ/RimL family protein N-acetyltransferase
MVDSNLLEHARPLIEASLGYELPDSAGSGPRLEVVPTADNSPPLFAVRIDQIVAAAARSEWIDQLRPIFDELHPDLLFSIFGSYELSRVTLGDGMIVWGSVPSYVADETTWRPVDDDRPVQLSESQVADVDFDLFWHCTGGGSDVQAHFGIYENGQLVGLASASHQGHNIYDIGIDSLQSLQSRGLGAAVVSAAGSWVLAQGGIPFATAAPWNVPSTRTLRKLGMKYVYSAMIGGSGPFLAPPQPFGQPLPGQPIYNYYLDWAMNKEILEKPG